MAFEKIKKPLMATYSVKEEQSMGMKKIPTSKIFSCGILHMVATEFNIIKIMTT
jgi:hypothetical protein